MSSSHGSKVIIVASNYVLQQAAYACQSTFNNVYRSTPDQLKKAYNTVCVYVCVDAPVGEHSSLVPPP